MKNILLIIPNLTMGGAQKSFTTLNHELAKEYNIVVVYFNKEEGVDYNIRGELISLNVKGGRSFIEKFFNFFIRIIRLRKIKKEKNISISISFLEGADFISILSLGKDKKIISVRGSKLNDITIIGFIGWLRKKILVPYLYKFADKIIVVNKGIKKELTDYFKIPSNKIEIIYNYYDFEQIKNLVAEDIPDIHKELLKRPYIISFGRLAPEKGLEYLLELYSEIVKELPDLILLIIGEGPSYNLLITKCQNLSLSFSKIGEGINQQTQVVFAGSDPNPFKYVSQATAFIMTSSSEGFPNALVESMICGTPTISTDCPWGPREILSPNKPKTKLKDVEYGEFGILLPEVFNQNSNFIQSLAQKITLILKNEDILKSYSTKGVERMKVYSIENMLIKWKEIIEKKY